MEILPAERRGAFNITWTLTGLKLIDQCSDVMKTEINERI